MNRKTYRSQVANVHINDVTTNVLLNEARSDDFLHVCSSFLKVSVGDVQDFKLVSAFC